eukprot:4190163-Ditylum_brightwellii.AAC.1
MPSPPPDGNKPVHSCSDGENKIFPQQGSTFNTCIRSVQQRLTRQSFTTSLPLQLMKKSWSHWQILMLRIHHIVVVQEQEQGK